MKEYFKPFTKSYFWDKYQVLIIDSYASYISIEFIIFTQVYKIICLYLLLYLTYLL